MRIEPEVLNDVIPRFLKDGWQVVRIRISVPFLRITRYSMCIGTLGHIERPRDRRPSERPRPRCVRSCFERRQCDSFEATPRARTDSC